MERVYKHKDAIHKVLNAFLNEKKEELGKINRWGSDVIGRIQELSSGGKLLRGCLLATAYEMYKGKVDADAIKAAAALEIVHSGLLIQDDIMDADILRRGKKTVFIQYADLAEKEKLTNPRRVGENMGVCAGDICFFLSYELLSTLKSQMRTRMIELFSKEFSNVAAAQMQDLYLGAGEKKTSAADVFYLHKYKAARYTFSLPLVLGAKLAEQSDMELTNLDELGESLGIMFQVKDDELNLFGSEKETGKSVLGDIKDDKKTLFRLHLFEEASEEETKKLKKIFGNSKASDSDLNFVLDLIEKKKIRQMVQDDMVSLEKDAINHVADLSTDDKHKQMFQEIVKYNKTRTK